MIPIFFKLYFSRLRPKLITCKNYKKFPAEKFLNDLKETKVIIDEKKPKPKPPIFNENIFNLCKQTRYFKKEDCARKSDPLYD